MTPERAAAVLAAVAMLVALLLGLFGSAGAVAVAVDPGTDGAALQSCGSIVFRNDLPGCDSVIGRAMVRSAILTPVAGGLAGGLGYVLAKRRAER